MTTFKRVKEMIGDKAHQVAFLMVSIDGTRDTPEEMKTYLAKFDTAFIGMTGSENDVEKIAIDYNVTTEVQPADSANQYTVDHTPSVYMIDAQGRLVMEYMYGTEPDVMVEEIQKLLS